MGKAERQTSVVRLQFFQATSFCAGDPFEVMFGNGPLRLYFDRAHLTSESSVTWVSASGIEVDRVWASWGLPRTGSKWTWVTWGPARRSTWEPPGSPRGSDEDTRIPGRPLAGLRWHFYGSPHRGLVGSLESR